MRDERGFVVWEEALRLVRGRDLGDYAGMLAPDGAVDLPLPLPGIGRSPGPRGETRSVCAPVWRLQPEVRPSAGGVPPAAVLAPDSDVFVIDFDLKGVEASGLPYRLGYVHVATVQEGHVTAGGEAVVKSAAGQRKRAEQEDRNKLLVHRCLETWSAPGFDGIESVISARCIDHAHPGLCGPEASVATARRLLGTTARPSISIDTLVGEGDLVAARTTVRHVLETEAVVTSGMTFFRVIEARIVEQWSCYPRATRG